MIRCPNCLGHGVIHPTNGTKCPECGGSGVDSLIKKYGTPNLEDGGLPLCDFDIELLRHLNGEDTDISWGAAMSVSLEFLFNRGYVTRVSKMSGLKYELTEAGKKIAEMHKKP